MTLADHRPYIKAVADHITAAGLTITDWQGSDNGDSLEAWIELTPDADGDAVTLVWGEHGWDWGWTDTTDRSKGVQNLDYLTGNRVEPPALVVACLLEACVPLRALLRSEIPDDEESALAAYAETGPRPGQQVATPSGGTWTYVDIGSGDLHLISTARLHSIAWTQEEFNDTLTVAKGAPMPVRDAADVMPAEEEAELIGVLDGLLAARAKTEESR